MLSQLPVSGRDFGAIISIFPGFQTNPSGCQNNDTLYYTVPTVPGLGATLDLTAVEKYREAVLPQAYLGLREAGYLARRHASAVADSPDLLYAIWRGINV